MSAQQAGTPARIAATLRASTNFFRLRSMNRTWKNDWPFPNSSPSSRVSAKVSPPVSGRVMVQAAPRSVKDAKGQAGMHDPLKKDT